MGNKKKSKNKPRYEIGPKKVINVRKEDYNVFQALDMDSFVVAESRRRIHSATTDDEETVDKSNVQSYFDAKDYGQKVPSYSKKKYLSKNPPIIPPHLLHYMLNKKPERQINPCNMGKYPAVNYGHLLPKPCHTLLNHLYAESMKDDIMTLSTTQRYRQKSVTTIFYRPVSTSD